MEVSGAVRKLVDKIENSNLRSELTFILGARDSPEFKEHLVLCAEKALQHNETAAATGFLDLYFFEGARPPNNQCLARAYLCRAQLHAPVDSKDLDGLNKCTDLLLKAVEFGKTKPRHYFLVYNASQLYWQLCRQFLRPTARKNLVKGLSLIVSALNRIGDGDHLWRATLMIEYAKCTVETGRKEDVIQAVKQASNFCQIHAPEFLPELVHLQVKYNLIDRKALEKELQSLFLICHCRLSHLKLLISSPEKQRLFPEKAKKLISLIAQGKETEAKPKSLTNKEALRDQERTSLLLALAHMCLEEGQTSQAQRAIDSILPSAKEGPSVAVDIEYLMSDLMVRQLGDEQELQSTRITDIRENAVKRCCQAVQSAVRLEHASLIQAGCCLLWNLCLPLLQPYCRFKAEKALRLIAETLEDMDSLQLEFRCVVHVELAKCDLDQERLEMALVNIDKALALDYYGRHSEHLTILRERLILKIKKNDIPPRIVDKAAQLVEQISTNRDKEWTVSSYRQALSAAGERLAPGVFKLTVTETSRSPSVPIASQLKEEVEQYELAASKTKDSFSKTSKEEDVKMCLVWADIAKISRENAVWDIAQSAARFCLQYDDERWEAAATAVSTVVQPRLLSALGTSRPSARASSRLTVGVPSELLLGHSRSSMERGHSRLTAQSRAKEIHIQSETTTEDASDLMARQLLRRLVEAHFIYAESLIELLLRKRLQLCDKPDISSFASRKDGISTSSPEWQKYCDWIQSLTVEAVSHFHRAAQLGCVLKEQWVVHQAMGYIFNYTNRAVTEGRHATLVPHYQPLIDMYMTLQATGEIELLCQLVTVAASGLMMPYVRRSDSATKAGFGLSAGKKVPDITVGGESPQSKAMKKQQTVTSNMGRDESSAGSVDPEGVKDLKAAAELCEQVNGICAGHDVSLNVRKLLLEVWVRVKHLLQQVISKPNYCQENPSDLLIAHCRALVVLEMLSCKDKPPLGFAGCPSVAEVVTMVESCEWVDPLIELEIWSRLAMIAAQDGEREVGLKCAAKAMTFSQCDVRDRAGTAESRNREVVQSEFLSFASRAKGLLQQLTGGDPATQRQLAITEFVQSAEYACKAKNYEMIMEAARHAWNLCHLVRSKQLDRELLREPLGRLLKLITDVTGQDRGRESEEGGVQLPKIGSLEDLDVRLELYILVFLSYADKSQWESGLKSVDEAIWYMPRSTHKTLIQYRIFFKTRLGKSVAGDIQRLSTEDEDFLTHLWHHVAKNSSNSEEQCSAFQAAIQVAKTKWQKIDILLEFANWMHLNELHQEHSIKMVETAVCLLAKDEGVTDHPTTTHIQHPEPMTGHKANRSKSIAVTNVSVKEKPIGANESVETDDAVSLPWLEKVTGCRRHESLLRCYVMLAQIAPRSSKQYLDNLMKAVGHCYAIWKLQDATLAHPGVSQGERDHQEEKKGKETKLSTNKRKEKVAQPALKSILPTSLVQWSTFQLSDEMREALQNDRSGNAVNKLTICQVARTVEALTALASELASNGLQALSLPVFALHHLLATNVACNPNMVDLLHLRIIDCCQQLGLSDGVEHHEQLVSSWSCRRVDQVEIVEKIDLNEDQRKRIEAEEKQQALGKTIQRDSSATTGESKGDAVNRARTPPARLRDHGKVEVIRIWIDQAELHLKQGRFQSARELLTFSLRAAMGFGESQLVRRSLCSLGKLALFEGEMSEAISLLSEAQKYPADLETWMLTLIDLAEAYRVDHNKKSQAIGILTHAITVFCELAEERPYLTDECNYIQAILQARCAKMKMEDISNTDRRRRARKRIEARQALELYVKSADELLQLGYTSKAVEVMLEHSRDLKIFAEGVTDTAQRHEKLLEIQSILQNAVLCVESLLTRTLPLVVSSQMNGCWLPVHRLVVEAHYEFGDLMLVVLAEECNRQLEARHAEDRKTREEKMLDEYGRMTPVLSNSQRMWESLILNCGASGLSKVMSSYAQTPLMQDTKGKAILQVGQFLCWMATVTATTTDSCWSLRAKEQSVETAVFSDRETSEGISDTEGSERVETVSEKRSTPVKTVWHFAQGTELLALAVQYSLENEDLCSAGQAALDLVECFGKRDQLQSTHYLSLYQSCRASEYLKSLIRKAQDRPGQSQLAALLHQRHHLRVSALGSLLETNRLLLGEKCEAYRRLHVRRKHFDLFSVMPSSLCFVVLQHSYDRRLLYGSVVLPNQMQSSGDDPPAIARTAVDPEQLRNLLEGFKEYKADRQQHLLRCDHLHGSQTHSQVALSSAFSQSGLQLDGDGVEFSAIDIAVKSGDLLEERFTECVMSLNAYLEPLVNQLPMLSSLEDVSAVVLLLDEWLLQLPIECISWLSLQSKVGMTRDASIQLFYHRIHDTTDDAHEAATTAAGVKKNKVGQTPKLEKGKDGERRKEKSGSVPVKPAPSSISVDMSRVKYIFDPVADIIGESDEGSKDVPTQQSQANSVTLIQNSIKSFGSLTTKWSGLTGADLIPSPGQWKESISGSSSFLFFGTERLLAYYPPQQLVPLDVSGCRVCVLADRAHTGASFLRQSKIDANKCESSMSLEGSVETALLLSISGVGAVIVNQYAATVKDNSQLLCDWLRGMLAEGQTIVQALQTWRQPSSPEDIPPPDTNGEKAKAERETVLEESTTHQDINSRTYNAVLYGLPHIIFKPNS